MDRGKREKERKRKREQRERQTGEREQQEEEHGQQIEQTKSENKNLLENLNRYWRDQKKRDQWKKASKQYYERNKETIKEYAANQYSIPTVSNAKKQKVNDRYSLPTISIAKKQKEKDRYSIPTVSIAKKQKEKDRYSVPTISNAKKQKVNDRYSIPTVSNAKKQKEKDRYSIPTVSIAKKQKEKDRYSIPTVSNTKKQKVNNRYSIPTVSNAKKQKEKDRYSIPTVSNAKKQKQNDRYSIPIVSNAKKQKEKDGYSIPTVSNAKKQKEKDRYSIPTVSNAKKQKVNDRYSLPTVSNAKKQKEKDRYSLPTVSNAKKQKVNDRYSLPTVSNAKKQKEKDRYSLPTVSNAKKQKEKDRYSVPTVSNAKKQKVNDRYSVPTISISKKQKEKDRYSVPTISIAKKQKVKDRYSIPTVSNAKKQKEKGRYSIPTVSAKKKRLTRLYYWINRKNKLKNLKLKYYKDKVYRAKKILSARNCSQAKKKKKSVISHCIQTFKKHCKDYPIFICNVCGRHMFKNQVVQLKMDKYNKKQYENAQACIKLDKKLKKKSWLCKTCQRYLKISRIPPQALVNNMDLSVLPQVLQELNVLERHLVSPVIPFMKIVVLPKSSQKGIHGPVICVNSDVIQVVKVLPRTVSEGTLIKVKLKRKMAYRGHHLYQQVLPRRVLDALDYFKEHNPLFRDIKIDDSHLVDGDSGSIVKESEDDTEEKEVANDESSKGISNELPKEKTLDESQDESEVNETTAPLYSSLQPVDLAQHTADLYEDHLISIAPAEKHTPIPVLKHEANAFAYHFPVARGTFTDCRNVKLTLKRYLNARLFSYDSRFASDPQYIFFAQYASEVNDICSSISIAMRKSSSDNISLEDIKSAESLRKVLKNDEGFRFLRNVRGSPMYWERAMKDAFAMLRQIGLPAFFITLSAADRRWPEMIESICHQTNKPIPESLDWSQYCGMINSNIVTATRMFDKRLKYFINDIIKSPSNPVGQVVDMFGRIEFQARGWPHYHGLLWVKDSPAYLESDANIVSEFIDRHITCSMPPKEDTELYDIVSAVQIHSSKHTKSCRKGGKECRFNFPRPPSQRTFITQSIGTDESNQPLMKEELAIGILQIIKCSVIKDDSTHLTTSQFLHKYALTQELMEKAFNTVTKKPTVVYKRDPSDCWVNGYNPTLLRAWNGNMDLQYVTDPYSCIMYIISYMTKSERELSQTIKTAQQEARKEDNPDAISELRNLGHVYMTHRDVSVMESVYRTCALPLKLATRDVVWIPSDPQSTRLTLPLNVLRQQNAESDKIWMTNILDRYYGRPKDLEDLCVADFASSYRILSKQEKNKKSIELMNDLGFIVKRKGKKAVIRYPRFQAEKDAERYYANILCLFCPHRHDVKPQTYELFEEFFKNGSVQTSGKRVRDIVLQNMERYEKLDVDLEAVWEEIKEMDLEDSWGNIAPSTEQEREDLDLEKNILNDFEPAEGSDKIPELTKDVKQTKSKSSSLQLSASITTVDNTEMHQKLKSLNERQQQIFNFIRSWCLQKNNGDVEPFHIFINGGAGTGKSHLIHCIRYEATKILQRTLENPDDISVVLAAFTGTAAFNVYGLTVHKAFSINTTTLPYQGLREESLNTLRSSLQNVSIIIIDEVSMISKPLMEYISGRFQQIKKTFTSKPFGNVSVIVVGDFYQLPPVTGKLLYTIDPGALPADLWSYFHIFNLTEVMRQKNDKDFAAMLNRLRTILKGEKLLAEDEKMLQSRLVSNDYPKEAIHIFATRQKVDGHNTEMINKLGTEILELEAADMIKSKGNKTYRRKTPNLDLRSSLPPTLYIAEGARIMLTSNLDVSDGLVNGVCGTVIKIIRGKMQHSLPDFICVKFDNDRVGVNFRKKYENFDWVPQNSTPISASSEKVKNKLMDTTRYMYPMKLAWGCTIHKVQGQTFKQVAISLQGVFRAGMSYVALSRCVNLDGIHLLDLDTKLIYADPNVANAMKKMPNLDVLPANPLYRNSETDLSIVHHNIQSLPAHYDDLKSNKELRNATIICLTETWLLNCKQPHAFSLDGYTFHEILPESSEFNKTSGIALFIKNTCVYTVGDAIVEPGLEVATIMIHEPQELFLSVIYCHPDSKSNLKNIAEHLIEMAKQNGIANLVVVGDFNEDLSKEHHPILDNFKRLRYTQVIDKPTTSLGTLLDHIYVYNVKQSYTASVMNTYYSYHDPVQITFPQKQQSATNCGSEETIATDIPVQSSPKQKKLPARSVTKPKTHAQQRKRKSTSKIETDGMCKKVKIALTQEDRIMGYESDSFTPPFPIPANQDITIPPHVLQETNGTVVRIVDMWAGNPVVFQLLQWLRSIGLNVIETITNRQRGPSCGYIAAHVAWQLHSSSDWRTQTLSSALDPSIIENYNAVLNQPLNRPTYLTDDQILDILSHLQYVHSGTRNVNWILGPMPMNYLIKYFREQFSGTRRRTCLQSLKIFIVNTTPVQNVLANLSQRTMSGDHWIVLAIGSQ